MTRSVTCLVCLLATFPAAGQAPDRASEHRFEVTPFAGYRMGGTFSDETTDAELELNNAGSFGLILNMREADNTEWELLYSHQDTDIDIGGAAGGSVNMNVDYLQIGGTYLGEGRHARPYLAATIGLAHLDPAAAELPSDTFFAFSIGTGFKLRPHERLGLRLEGRLFGTVIDSDSKIFCVSGSSGSGCLINTKADVLWQVEISVGAIVRF